MPSTIGSLRTRARRGSYFVEAALVITVGLFTLIGIVDVGQVLVLHQGIVERVRAGCRWGVVNTFDQTKIKNVVLYNTPNPPNGAKPLLGLTADVVSANQYAANTPEWRIIVQVSNYQFRFFSPWLKGLYTARPIMVDMSGESLGAIN